MAEPVHLAGGNLVAGHIFNIWMLRLTYLFFVCCSLLFFVVLDLPSGTDEEGRVACGLVGRVCEIKEVYQANGATRHKPKRRQQQTGPAGPVERNRTGTRRPQGPGFTSIWA